ncbi:MAG: shikimate dehydrogenase [Candidatus Omnitrophica bacterium]|nr:shikimate dehydrogenase [Candidatus Omnitrophota bacterium]
MIGWPLGHSLSAAMHNAAFKALGVEAEYKLFPLRPEELNPFLENLDTSGIAGLNVTVPYKEKALKFVKLDKESAFLKTVGAINTMARKNNAWHGFNTDIPGFRRHLKEHFEPRAKKAAILGCGGACRAVAFVLAQEEAAEIRLFDIEPEKPAGIVRMIKGLFPDRALSAVDSVEKLDIGGSDLLVNATPVGLKQDDPSLVPGSMLRPGQFVYDLIYNPRETKLLAAAQKAGAQTANGLGMLLYQGMYSFEIWTGRQAPEGVMREALDSALAGH